MRKKFLAALGVTLALCLTTFSAPSQAAVGLKDTRVDFRRSANTEQGYTLVGVSVKTVRTIDTTETIPISTFGIPSDRGGSTANDTLTVGFLHYYPVASGATGDSLEIGMQVSIDGVNWQTGTPNILYNASFEDVVGGAKTINGAIVLERGTTNAFFRRINVQVGAQSLFLDAPVQNATTAPTELEWAAFKFVRFLLGSDVAGSFACSISHFKNEAAQ